MPSDFTIDLDKTIRDKNPKLYRMLPRFLMNYLKKIAHQNDVNEILSAYGAEHSGLSFNRKVLEHLNVSYDVENAGRLPSREGRYLFVSNHPLGALDGIVLMDFIGAKYGAVKFVVNDILMYLKPLQELFAPVNKHGRQTAEYVRQIDELYASDKQVLYFPAGLCSRKLKGRITDLEWKKNFVAKAIKYRRDVVPLFFDGRNSNFFYNLANIRKRLGIKVNLEMLWLSDEFFKKANARFTIKTGDAIPYGTLADMGVKTAVKYVREQTYSMSRWEKTN
ncbi:MAG: 1-acyl-sn-glycerol-3-phosphate acyltransferase [Prevotellaceae bacterium]|nr:1-acyl-sn-glycerol-3-phosphate acyltransferase [Prevotellaceae bacterium]